MGIYNFKTLSDKIINDNNLERYVIIHNLKDEDYTSLQRVRKSEVLQYSDKNGVESFESRLNSFIYMLLERNIPFDRINIRGNAGVIINNKIHRLILEKYMQENIIAYRQNRFMKTLTSRDIKEIAISVISNLIIEDRTDDFFYDIVPIHLKFNPEYLMEGAYCDSYEYIGIKNFDMEYKGIVCFNAFIDEINKDGFFLKYDGEDIKNFEDYLNRFVKTYDPYNSELSMTIDLNNNNNNIHR